MEESDKNNFKREKLKKKHINELDDAIDNLAELLSMADKELEQERLDNLEKLPESDLNTSKIEH